MEAILGNLDGPRDGAIVTPGSAMTVSGWVLFQDEPPDEVWVWVGDAHPVLARRGLPRADVVSGLEDGRPTAIACGFETIVLAPAGPEGTVVPVHVRATSERGQVWTADAVQIRIGSSVGRPTDEPVASDLPAPPTPEPGTEPEPLRICVFTHSLHLGGGELYLDELLRRMTQQYAVELLVVSPAGGTLLESLRSYGAAVHITHQYAIHPHHYDGHIRELQLLITGWGADVVIGNTLGVFPAIDAALRLDLPVLWAIHESFTLEEFISLNWGTHGMSTQVEARMRHVLAEAHTIFEAEATLELYASQIPGLRGRHIHYGIEVGEIELYCQNHPRDQVRAELGYEPGDLLVLCMGVIQERKAQLALLTAFSQVASTFPQARLALVGSHGSTYSVSVEELADSLGLSGKVDILPIQPEIYPWYRAADVLVSASDIESLPRSILEAKAFGLPTLATDVFGLAEVITDGVNGWLCRPNSGSALVAGLARALSLTDDERRRMSEACREEAPRFDGSGYADSYYRLARSLVQSRRYSDFDQPETTP
jgi:D-inositol-3-phosphate glycosyltransferase